MSETRNILGWLGMAEEQSVMRDAEQHVRETCHTVAALFEAAQAFVSGDNAAKMKAIEEVRKSERAADELVWKMINKLSEGLLLPPDREDLLRFAKALDAIADSTNRAARLLGFIEKGLPKAV
jgi:predicted phosphate transport protein (TIGR00153 family)